MLEIWKIWSRVASWRRIFVRFLVYEKRNHFHIPCFAISTYNEKSSNFCAVLSLEVLCIVLRQVTYSCGYMIKFTGLVHLILKFHSLIQISNFTYARLSHLLSPLDHTLLSAKEIFAFANAVHDDGGAIDSSCSLIDGTASVRVCYRPGKIQMVIL